MVLDDEIIARKIITKSPGHHHFFIYWAVGEISENGGPSLYDSINNRTNIPEVVSTPFYWMSCNTNKMKTFGERKQTIMSNFARGNVCDVVPPLLVHPETMKCNATKIQMAAIKLFILNSVSKGTYL